MYIISTSYSTPTRAITNIIDREKVGCPEKWLAQPETDLRAINFPNAYNVGCCPICRVLELAYIIVRYGAPEGRLIDIVSP